MVYEPDYDPMPTAFLLEEVYDIGIWIFPCLEPIKNHSQPHVFCIKKNLKWKGEKSYEEIDYRKG